MERSEIVTNGCTGDCCARFELRYSLDCLKLMQEALKNKKTVFIDSYGVERRVQNDNDLDYIVDMIIPLGLSNIQPQKGIRYNQTPSVIQFNNEELKQRGYVKDIETGEISAHVYTCKHFDKESKVCKEYASRPRMCSSYCVEDCSYNSCAESLMSRIEASISSAELNISEQS